MNIRACSESSDKIPFKGLRPWIHPGLVFSLFYLLFDNIRMANLKSNVSPPFGWLFIECSKAECFFSATQWRIFIEIGRHGVRSGLPVWMRKTCFQAAMPASMSIGCNPQANRFLFSFFHGSMSLIYKNNQIKKRNFLLFISMYGSQILRASSPICSPSM